MNTKFIRDNTIFYHAMIYIFIIIHHILLQQTISLRESNTFVTIQLAIL
jgi:hypothetical protein